MPHQIVTPDLPKIDFGKIPQLGETVFRLPPDAGPWPVLVLVRESGHREQYDMVRGPAGDWMVALTLPDGEYLYYYSVKGIVVPDPFQLTTVRLQGGISASVRKVKSPTQSWMLENRTLQRLVGEPAMSHDCFEVDPKQVSVPARSSQELRIALRFPFPTTGRIRAVLSLRSESDEEPRECVSVHADVGSDAAILTCGSGPFRDNDGRVKLQLSMRGAGTIDCHVVNRLKGEIERLRFEHVFPQQETRKTWSAGYFDAQKVKAFGNIPWLIVLSNSVLVEQRRIEHSGDPQ
jgi:hypothetical protein